MSDEQKNRAAGERFHRQALRAEQAWRDGGRWECEECGWPWPLAGKPPAGSECDNCGGEMTPAGREQ